MMMKIKKNHFSIRSRAERSSSRVVVLLVGVLERSFFRVVLGWFDTHTQIIMCFFFLESNFLLRVKDLFLNYHT